MTAIPTKTPISFRAAPHVSASLQQYVTDAQTEHGQHISTSQAVHHLLEERLHQLQRLPAVSQWPPACASRVRLLEDEVQRLTTELASLRSSKGKK